MDEVKKIAADYNNQIIIDLVNANSESDLEKIKVHYLGRTGLLADLMNKLKMLSLEDKRVLGPLLNNLKKDFENLVEGKRLKILQQIENEQNKKFIYFDVTAYKPNRLKGSLHPYTIVVQDLEDMFISMGFQVIDGPEVEDSFHNFTALNIPDNHPARDMQDTFWLTLPDKLMRTHTSSVEIRTMCTNELPIAMVVMGRCYRNEATDASHDFMFMQLEGLYVAKKVSLAHLFATIEQFLTVIFNRRDIKMRVRPSYFPFVEPGVEVDVSCPFCLEGCSVCKKTKWIEMGGAGLTHPNVLRACGIDPDIYTGFAFGFGLTRLVMLKYGITDIRLLHSNKLDFLQQF